MDLNKYFVIGQKVFVNINDSDYVENIKCSVEKIKSNLLGISFSSENVGTDTLHNGKVISIFSTVENRRFKIKSSILSNKTYPIVIIKPEKVSLLLESKNDSSCNEKIDLPETLIPSDTDYVSQREFARIVDNFEIEYYKQSKEETDNLKKEILLRPSIKRPIPAIFNKKESITNNQNILDSISDINPQVIDVLKDIYSKIDYLSSKIDTPENTNGDTFNNIGICEEISGNGLKINLSKKYNVGDILILKIAPNHADKPFSIIALGEVVRIRDIGKSGDTETEYSTGIKFYAIHEDDMETITQYTFSLQQELLRARHRAKD